MTEYPQFAYTGPTPEVGQVGFVNIQETDTGVRITVRAQGDYSNAVYYEIPIGEAIQLFGNALEALCDRE